MPPPPLPARQFSQASANLKLEPALGPAAELEESATEDRSPGLGEATGEFEGPQAQQSVCSPAWLALKRGADCLAPERKQSAEDQSSARARSAGQRVGPLARQWAGSRVRQASRRALRGPKVERKRLVALSAITSAPGAPSRPAL